MHEIVTLQFGQRANYLATHFWNTQESYFTYSPSQPPSLIDHDITFRPGIGTDGSDTYTPRTIIYDLKGGFGTLKQQNALYDDTTNTSQTTAWTDHGLSTIKQVPIAPIPYQQDLEAGLPTSQLQKSQVRYWSDFNRVFFHPRSIVQLNEYSLNSSIAPFESWSAGEELFRDVDREADLLDRDVRVFAEECDGKKSVWVYGVEDSRGAGRERMVGRKANVARTVREVGGLASGYVMLGTGLGKVPGYLRCDSGSEWEGAALLAAAVESVSLATRLREGRCTMGQVEEFLGADEGMSIWELGMSVDSQEEDMQPNGNGHGNGSGNTTNNATDARVNHHDQTQNIMQTEDLPEDIEPAMPEITFTSPISHLLPPTPNRSRTSVQPDRLHTFTRLLTARHPRTSRIPFRTTTSSHDLYSSLPIIQTYDIPLPYPKLDSSPSLFSFPGSSASHSVSASFSTTTAMKSTLLSLRDLVTRYTRSIALDEREELYDSLTGLGERYTFGFEDDEDENEDGWGSGEEG